jgi:hypothetical protein
MNKASRPLVAAALVASAFGACLYPNEVGEQLVVQLDDVPELMEGDSLTLSAQLTNAGSAVPNAEIAFSVADPTIVAVSASGRVVALDSGATVVTATAVGYAGAAPAQQSILVHSLVEVDSIAPANVRFGDTLTLFGAGLDPASLSSVQLGGFSMRTKSFVPLDPARPERFGRLSFWVEPPAGAQSTVQVTSTRGSRVLPNTVTVQQRDIFEPNDTAPRRLTLPMSNPGMALEIPERGSTLLYDWYKFRLTQPGDVSIRVRSPYVATGVAFQVLLTDSLYWTTNNGFFLGNGAWTVGAGFAGSTACNGTYVNWGSSNVPFQAAADAEFALSSLPAGTYHIWIPYSQVSTFAMPYELDVATTYRSLLPADASEENDYCEAAAPLADALSGGGELTIDNPLDQDWFSLTVPSGGRVVALQLNAAVDTADIDMYFVDPSSSYAVAGFPGIVTGPEELAVATLPAGDFYFITADYPGVPSEYTLSAVPKESEANDNLATADTVVLDRARTVNLFGEIGVPGDSDYVAFYAEAGNTVELETKAAWFDSPLDSYLVLRDSAGALLDFDDDGGLFAPDSRIVFDVITSGWYRLLVTRYPFAGTAGPGYYYVLQSRVTTTEATAAATRAVASAQRRSVGAAGVKATAAPRRHTVVGQSVGQLSPTMRAKVEAVRKAPTKLRASRPQSATLTPDPR